MFFLVTTLASYLAWVFLGQIRIAALIAAIKGINNIDSGGWSGVFIVLFLILITESIFFSLFWPWCGLFPIIEELKAKI